ncbi:GNAT family N-acetyltransferase [Achromobacter sp. Marseille-Q4962]|uniref:GNAT family N-acetyltransferase n=1 Tax=Achromobacter sp. Marseille-Q4962 TaxID=2942202 RepID=UPI002072C5A4|nr:GNAT family N-acetyltransferase [Achromobacter sp. Marseille-Q4962]
MSPDDTPVLRPASEDDLPFLLALRRAAMGPHLRRAGAPLDEASMLARVRHRFEDARIVWLGGRRAGLFKVTREPGRWHVAQIQIDPSLQGRGLGRRLLSGLLDEADAQGVPVTLSVLKDNPARRLYESLGFAIVGAGALEYDMRREPGRRFFSAPGE